MRGIDVTDTTAPLDSLFIEGSRRGLTTIGIGDGGNEIGMGKVFADALATVPNGRRIATTVPTDFCIAAGVSNWGAYGLAGALSVLEGRDLLPSAEEAAHDIEWMVQTAGAADGVTHRTCEEPTVDGLDLGHSLRMLEDIRRQIARSPLEGDEQQRSVPPVTVGVLGYGETGRAAAALLARTGHRACISDSSSVTLEPGAVLAGVETGGHTIEFFKAQGCDLVVTSPGVRRDAPILGELHRLGVPVMSELELAFQLGSYGHAPNRKLIAITGTVGKRTTVELLQETLRLTGRSMMIGGNRGRPLSELLLEDRPQEPIAVAVSSFQLETVVNFRPDIAVILNISEAHLDRHRTVAEYIRIKSRIFMNQRPDDALVLPYDDPKVRALARKHQGRTFFVSSRQAVDRGAWLAEGEVHVNIDGTIENLGQARPPFPENFLSVVVTARLAGIGSEEVAAAVRRLPTEGGES
jgi:hypothetical protein